MCTVYVVCLMVRTRIDNKKAMLVAIYCISLAYIREIYNIQWLALNIKTREGTQQDPHNVARKYRDWKDVVVVGVFCVLCRALHFINVAQH